MTRIFTFKSPLGDDLMFRSLAGKEEFSGLFQFTVTLLSEKNSIQASQLLGKGATIEIETEGESKRFLNGQVISFQKTSHGDRYTEYQAELAPWFWYATRTADCKIFQNKTAVQIADEVFADYPFPVKKKLHETYLPIGYYVQYNESDFQFLSRLFEQEGIYYYFEHSDGEHALVLADFPSSHGALSGHAEIQFAQGNTNADGKERIRFWTTAETVRSGSYVTSDYFFKKPSANLQQKRSDPKQHKQNDYEVYNWGQGFSDPGHGAHLAKVELESIQQDQAFARGETTVRELAPGYTFKMVHHPDNAQNIEYLIIGTSYFFQENPYATGVGGDHTEWSIKFTVQKSSAQYRPAKVTPWPPVGGPHTAVVSGPKGEEIWTDKYGRVKVQFPWDRYGKNDENSSCWIRVSSPWAGSNFGGVQIPRIGQEVLIEYINGEVNRPIITGRVYNENQMPPWDLPANATQSGYLTRSSKGGGYDNANAIRFEDKKGAEQLWLHAEKDQLTEVEHDEDKWVGHDRRKTIDHDETTKVGHDRTETVVHNETITIGVDRTETVGSNETIAIGQNRTETVGANETVTIAGNRAVTIAQNKSETIAMAKAETIGLAKALVIGGGYQIAVGAAMNTTVAAAQAEQVGQSKSVDVGKSFSNTAGDQYSVTTGDSNLMMKSDGTIEKSGSKVSIIATDEFSVTCGDAQFVMKKDGTIQLTGKEVLVKGTSHINVKADGNVVVKGTKIGLN